MQALAGHFDLKNWLYGVGGAAISGFASSASNVLAVMYVAPEDFNLTNPLPLLRFALASGVIGAVVGFLGVLKTTPLPKVVE
jgi:hypothetical protein